MGFIFDIILDLVFDVSKNKKMSKSVRYFLVTIIFLFLIFIIGLINIVGISLLKDNLLEGILTILFGILLLVVCIIEFRKAYMKKK